MNWILVLMPALIALASQLQKTGKITKPKLKKAILAAVKAGEIFLPKELPYELFVLLVPIMVDLLWAGINPKASLKSLKAR